MTLLEMIKCGLLTPLTGHDLNVVVDGQEFVVPADKQNVVRVNTGEVVKAADGVYWDGEMSRPQLPPQDGRMFVVSLFVATAMKAYGIERDDIFVGGTGPSDGAIRENGNVKAITRIKYANWPRR
jgi:hypothetical protein